VSQVRARFWALTLRPPYRSSDGWTDGPFKPGFGLSGTVLQLDGVFQQLFRIFVSSISNSIFPPSQPVTGFGPAFNIPTLNFVKNAKFRMGHPSYIIAPTIYEAFKGDGSAFARK
jgi:hypothetical protein